MRTRTATGDLDARGGGCDLLYRTEQLPSADAAKGVSAIHHDSVLLLPLAGRWHLVPHQPCSGDAGAGVGGARGEPVRRHYRQPIGEDHRLAAGPRGYDAGKKISGRKRHLLVDKIGLVIAAIVHRADIQDRDGAPLLLATMRSAFPWLRHIFADGGYAGEKLRQALAKLGRWTVDIVRRSDTAKGFEPSPQRSCSPAGLPGNSPTPPDYESDSQESHYVRYLIVELN